MLAQVTPVAPENVVKTLEENRNVLGVTKEQWKVVLSGLIGAYFPSVSRPGWWLTGPSGAGKTTRGRMMAGLVDPMEYLGGHLNLKRDERNARTAASNTFIFSTDNATEMSQRENDWWCRLHTGVAETARKLHSDNTKLSWKFRRIGLATSLVMPPGIKPDALRRMLLIELRGTDNHPDVRGHQGEVRPAQAEMMGALFCVITGVLAYLGDAMARELDDCPEMSDFARLLLAADLAFPGLGDPAQADLGGLYAAYKQHAFDVLVQAGVGDQLALLVMGLVTRDATRDESGKKKLTRIPGDLLKALRKMAGEDAAEEWFPVDATRLGERLTQLDGSLRRLGIVVTRAKHTNRGTPYVFTKVEGPKSDAGSDAGK